MDAHLYLRQSLDKTGTAAAVARQEKECRAFAKRHGLRIVAVHTDNDVSATSGVGRPAFEKMLEAKPESILAWHQDRLLRLTRDLERVISLDVPVFTVMAGTLDLSTPAGRAVARTVAAWSQYETEQKGERQKAAHRQRAANGQPWGSTKPYGYTDASMQTIDEDEAEVLRGMYDDLLAGVPQAAIARGLNESGIASAKGGAWRQSSVRQVLIHPRNAGLRAHTPGRANRDPHLHVVGEGAWPSIVSEETWRAAVAVMTSSGPRKGGGRRTSLLTGLARCGVCDAPLRTAQTIRGVGLYACSDGAHVGRNREALDRYVVDVILERLSRPDALELITVTGSDDGAMRREADAARTALDALADMYAAGELTLSAFRSGTQRGRERLDQAEAAMIDAGRADRLAGLVGSKDIRGAWSALDLSRQRGVIDAHATIVVERTTRGARFRPEDVRIVWM